MCHIKTNMSGTRYIIVLLVLCLAYAVSALSDPYKVLGVSRLASVTDIKRAYKRLAREWHPDKNKEPGAEEKFIEINKAHELLMDPERKRQFDRYGTTEDAPNFRQQPDYSQFRRFDFDPFESIFSQGGYNFQFKFNQGSVYHKYTVTSKAYANHILPNSNVQPYLILFYGELCFPCLHAEPVWQKLVQELEPLGLGVATIHAQHESALAHKIGVSSVPYMIGVIEGRAVHYKDPQLSFIKAVDFCRRMIPPRTVVSLTDDTVDAFLQGWYDNRVRVLIFSKAESIRLRYLLIAYKFHHRAAFGHIRLGVSQTEAITKRYQVHSQMESLLVFNEDSTRPVATLSMAELSTQIMTDVIETNKFLLLPRLSSQILFDQMCPPEVIRAKKNLCVILITQNDPAFDSARSLMRDYIKHSDLPNSRVRFMFLFAEKQQEFLKALTNGKGSPENPLLRIVLLWRKAHDRVKYQWLENEWRADSQTVNATKEELNKVMNRFMQNSDALLYDAKVAMLTDEHASSLLARIFNRMILMGDVLWDNITRQEILPVVSVIMSMGFIVLVGFIMSYLVQLEEQKIQEKYTKEGKQVPGINPKSKPEYRLHIHELRGETYNGLVRLLKPGCRTIVLLVDNESKIKLLPNFYRKVYPYRKNKTLMFAFLSVEKNLEWYRRLLLQTLGEHRELNINPKNCIGTVLSLNGHRKYFCVYHAKHEEQNLAAKSKTKKNSPNSTGGDFIGFEDTNSESEASDVEAGNLSKKEEESIYDSIIFEEHLLDGLSNWLDRLFEGTTQRYYIQFWPDNMK